MNTIDSDGEGLGRPPPLEGACHPPVVSNRERLHRFRRFLADAPHHSRPVFTLSISSESPVKPASCRGPGRSIATTVFVIITAWRSAVEDADVEPVGEGE